MTADAGRGSVPRFEARQLSTSRWGMLFFILSESILFSLLLTSYFYLRGTTETWPPGGVEEPGLVEPAINTVILLLSSVPLFFLSRAVKGNRRGRAAGLMAMSVVLGAVFLAIQAREVRNLEFDVSDSAYASIFVTVTGFHAAHLVVGILMLGFALARTAAWRGIDRHAESYENTSYYWHFVDVVWIAVFATLHISPHLLGKG